MEVKCLHGSEIGSHLGDLAALRVRVFREFPYLYAGDRAYEEKYLRTYVDSPDSVLVLVLDAGRVVGASTGLPLADEMEPIRRPFLARGEPLERYFYHGESVLLPDYRGRGLGVRFFREREAHARALGRFDYATFCAVVRPADHPRRPAGYVPLDAFWTRRGYRKVPGLETELAWQDLDEDRESPKRMQFWVKALGDREET